MRYLLFILIGGSIIRRARLRTQTAHQPDRKIGLRLAETGHHRRKRRSYTLTANCTQTGALEIKTSRDAKRYADHQR